MRAPLAAALIASLAAPAAAQGRRTLPVRELLQPITHVVDAPTAGALDYGGFSTRNRFYADGGLLTFLEFGVFQRLTLGASVSADRLIGNDSSIRINRPEIQVKIRFFDGDRYLPALAVGFDGQGLFYDRSRKEYLEDSRGLYLAASRELFLPGLQIHPSVNIFDFEGDAFAGAVAATYTLQEKATLLFEWDNIGHDNRINAGLRVHVTPFFWLDLAAREIGKDSTFRSGAPRRTERIVQLKYISSF